MRRVWSQETTRWNGAEGRLHHRGITPGARPFRTPELSLLRVHIWLSMGDGAACRDVPLRKDGGRSQEHSLSLRKLHQEVHQEVEPQHTHTNSPRRFPFRLRTSRLIECGSPRLAQWQRMRRQVQHKGPPRGPRSLQTPGTRTTKDVTGRELHH